MKNIIGISGVFVALSLMAFVNKKMHTDIYKVDTNRSSLEWYADKINGKHNGILKISKGEIKNNHGNISGSLEIDMTSIEDKDLKPGKSKTKLETHLKSADFFDVNKFPTSKFIIISAIPTNDATEEVPNYRVKGLLTIKDKTNEISFNAIIKMEDDHVSCIGSAIIDRSKFDVRYGSKTFFPNIGDKLIYDEFKLSFKIVAVK